MASNKPVKHSTSRKRRRVLKPYEAVIADAAVRIEAENLLEQTRLRLQREKIERIAARHTAAHPLPAAVDLFAKQNSVISATTRVSIGTQSTTALTQSSSPHVSNITVPVASKSTRHVTTASIATQTFSDSEALVELKDSPYNHHDFGQSGTATTPQTAKLTRTQRRKAKIRASFAANPDLPRLSRRERKKANALAYELIDLARKTQHN